jgi:hypothetical protein
VRRRTRRSRRPSSARACPRTGRPARSGSERAVHDLRPLLWIERLGIAVEPTTSQDSIVTTRRSPCMARPARAASSFASIPCGEVALETRLAWDSCRSGEPQSSKPRTLGVRFAPGRTKDWATIAWGCAARCGPLDLHSWGQRTPAISNPGCIPPQCWLVSPLREPRCRHARRSHSMPGPSRKEP